MADHIGNEPLKVNRLASECNVDADALDRVLRLLVAHGVFKHEGDGYAHTESSRLLRSDHPMSMRAFSRMIGLPVFWASLGHLQDSTRTGSPAVDLVEPQGVWAYFQNHPHEAQIFGQAMTAKAAADIAAVLGAYDFSRFGTIADIGGGRGHLLRAVLDAVPAAEGVLFDLPSVIETLDIHLERLSPQAGDFFVDQLPTVEAYILMEVLHDWADKEATDILRGIRRAASPGAAVLVIEGVVAEEHVDPRVQTLDVLMLTMTGGRERTTNELDALLQSAGFRLANVIETAGPMRIVEGVAV